MRPYVVLTRAGVRVGILGVGVNPKGLVAEKNFYPLRYLEPIPVVQKAADELKNTINAMSSYASVILVLMP